MQSQEGMKKINRLHLPLASLPPKFENLGPPSDLTPDRPSSPPSPYIPHSAHSVRPAAQGVHTANPIPRAFVQSPPHSTTPPFRPAKDSIAPFGFLHSPLYPSHIFGNALPYARST